MENIELIKAAKKGMRNAYAPYSKFQVGAAVLTIKNNVYTGCNIENASFGATNCAERTAIFKAISEGEREFAKIAVVSSSNDLTYPCGICRQVLGEFMPNGEVILVDKDDNIKIYKVEEFLPYRFILEDDK
ncbi:cytidine deaminase [Natranaerovirga pectinivora]|uniref:Cytidine deaminase n=1 Tax=Natranaerovirga pectinivora TaxID=682400 RepID=A0A4R3MPA9_9FIRM|nr:cytidine deaminase [Natranaerovirga pectinivora]TCT17061.1 cytidine deaminase [Natranaerovirga pectinivora]